MVSSAYEGQFMMVDARCRSLCRAGSRPAIREMDRRKWKIEEILKECRGD
jgi:hypothetical protein